MEDIMRLDPVNYSLDRYNYNLAEIICIRSWAYLQLVKIWGDVPYFENSVKDLDAMTDIAPMSGDDILIKLDSQMTYIANPTFASAYTVSGMGNTYYSQFNNRSCPLLLSEIQLYRGEYGKADKTMRVFFPYGSLYRCSRTGAGEYNWIKQFIFGNSGFFTSTTGMALQFDGSRGQKNSVPTKGCDAKHSNSEVEQPPGHRSAANG